MEIIKNLSKIACDAGSILLEYFKRDINVVSKPDGSPVTEADRKAEEYIISKLYGIYPDIPAVGEESYASYVDVESLPQYWLIDPLDGTKDYIAGSNEFTVNIALINSGLPVAGVIYAPAMDLLYVADINNGAFKTGGGFNNARLPVAADERPFTVTVSRRHSTAGVEENLINTLRKKVEVTVLNVSSSIKYCMVAEGAADLYFRAGRTMYWDSAAGHAIAKCAGFVVKKWEDGSELTYSSNKLENPSFVVYNPKSAGTLLDL